MVPPKTRAIRVRMVIAMGSMRLSARLGEVLRFFEALCEFVVFRVRKAKTHQRPRAKAKQKHTKGLARRSRRKSKDKGKSKVKARENKGL